MRSPAQPMAARELLEDDGLTGPVPWGSHTAALTTPFVDAYGVVVGVDGSASSCRGLRWAAHWADLHRQQMLVIGAVEQATRRQAVSTRWHRMANTLEREVAYVAKRYPRLHIDQQTTAGSPARLLAEASRHAWTVVVGSRGLHPGDARGPSSVSCAAVIGGHCPTVVVPARLDDVGAHGPVVLGCDGSPDSVEATAFAFACAGRLQVPILVVNTQPHAAAGGDAHIAATLAGFERLYPSVYVRMLRPADSVVSTLCSAAANATLIVVSGPSVDVDCGPRPVGRLELLHQARRPVAFVGARGGGCEL